MMSNLLTKSSHCANHNYHWMKISMGEIADLERLTNPKRKQKIDLMRGHNSENDDFFQVFPDCQDCNPSRRVIYIPNTNPVIEIVLKEFPNCVDCNTCDAGILLRSKI